MAGAQSPSASLQQADADYRAGVAALNKGDLKTARAKFEETVRLAPQAEQGHSALGAVLVQQGHAAEGIRELERALGISASDRSAQMNLAVAYEQTGETAKALALFARADGDGKLGMPGYVEESYARALARREPGEALVRMRRAVAAEPGNAEFRDELGTLYAQARQWADAEREFGEALRLSPGFAAAHLHLGFVLQAEQKPEAADEWMKAAEAAPDDVRIQAAVGKALAGAGDDAKAEPVLEQALKLDAKPSEAAYGLGLIRQREGRLPEAIALLKQVAAAEPKNGEALTNLGMALSQSQRAKEAVPLLERAIALEPKNATAHQDLAAAYIQLNQMDDAERELEAALRLAPDSPQLHYNLGLVYKMQDDSARAIPELEKAEKMNPSAPEPAYVLGLEYMQEGRYDDAARELETSLKLKPENGDGWATLGSVYNKLDRLPEAEKALREAVRQLPDKYDPHLTLAAVLVKENQTAEAAAERKTAAGLMQTSMNRQRAEVATHSGKSLLEDGKTDDAIAQFREALGFDSKYAEAHLELAAALEKQGKKAEADAERKQASLLDNQ